MTDTALTGIYGGTFNPIHRGHLRAAEQVREQLGLQQVIFVPSARPPHKRGDASGDPIAPAEQRLAWVRAAVAPYSGFEVDTLEVDRDGPSFLVDTLRELGERFAPQRLVFVLGADAFQEMDTWREPEKLFTLAHFAVTTRPPLRDGRLTEWLPEGLGNAFEIAQDGLSATHRTAGTWIRLLEIDALDVSASEIRKRIREGADVRYLLPETIHDLVVQSGCYVSGTQSRPPILGSASGSVSSTATEPERRAEQSFEKLKLVLDAALDRGAQMPLALDIRAVTSFADSFVLLSGRSDRQVRAIAESIVDALRAWGDGSHAPLGIEGLDEGRWVLIDCNDVIVHIFEPEMRDLYALERLWSDAPAISLEAIGLDPAAIEAAGTPETGVEARTTETLV